MIPTTIFCTLLICLLILIIFNLIEIDNEWGVPQIITAIFASLLAFILSIVLANGQVADTQVILLDASSQTADGFVNTTHVYSQYLTYVTDPTLSLFLQLIGVFEGFLAFILIVLVVVGFLRPNGAA